MKKLTIVILSTLFITHLFAEDLTDGCDLPDSETTGYLHLTTTGSILYQSPYDIGGFQFNIDGTTLSGASGGDAGSAGFMISSLDAMVLGFSITGSIIPAGCGTLVNIDLDGEATGLVDIIIFIPKN